MEQRAHRRGLLPAGLLRHLRARDRALRRAGRDRGRGDAVRRRQRGGRRAPADRPTELPTIDRTALAVLSVDALLDGLGLDAVQRLEWYRGEVGARHLSSDDYRERQRALRRLLGEPTGYLGEPGGPALRASSPPAGPPSGRSPSGSASSARETSSVPRSSGCARATCTCTATAYSVRARRQSSTCSGCCCARARDWSGRRSRSANRRGSPLEPASQRDTPRDLLIDPFVHPPCRAIAKVLARTREQTPSWTPPFAETRISVKMWMPRPLILTLPIQADLLRRV